MQRLSQIFRAPGKYIQGAGVVKQVGSHVKHLGENILVIGGEIELGIASQNLINSFEEEGLNYQIVEFNGECCDLEVERIIEEKNEEIDFVLGIGGGKSLDTSKFVAQRLNLPVAVFPTLASTDAPCSALSVIYTPEGEFERYEWLKTNPDIVILDTQIVADAPSRFLVAGIGDALATFFEAEQCTKTQVQSCAGGRQTLTSDAIGELCLNTLLRDGEAAVIANDNHVVTPALDNICEANTLLSGLGFESGGIAMAHSVHNGLTNLDETHHFYHGEKVNIGTLTQLVLQNEDPEFVESIYKFSIDVGLPVTLEEIGVDVNNKEALMIVAGVATSEGETGRNMPFPVTQDLVYSSIVAANALGEKYKKKYA